MPFFVLDTVDGFDSWGYAKFMKESMKRCAVLSLEPESQFGIYIPEEAFVWDAKHECCWSSKAVHIRGHNGCVLVVLYLWD